MNDNNFLKDHIEELKEILELDEFPDLESRLAFAAHIGDCEDWLKNGEQVTSAPCSLCGGAGKFREYDDEWVCHSCFGTGTSFYKA